MAQSDYETIYSTSKRLVRETATETKRFLLESVDWNNRLIGIQGSRGTGKTTLILQHIKESFANNPDAALYVSLDNLWFETHSLKDLVEFHYNQAPHHENHDYRDGTDDETNLCIGQFFCKVHFCLVCRLLTVN